MNSVNIIGRITQDIELRKTNTGKSVTTISVAVPSGVKDENGKSKADFIPVVVWDKSAEYLNNYGSKGARVSVSGLLKVRSYVSNDKTNYVLEVHATNVELFDYKNETITPSVDISEDDLPF